MAKQTVGRTALGAAICRLIEQYQPEETRLFCDPVGKEVVGGPIKFLMQFATMRNYTIKRTDAAAKGIYGAQICRTRYIDDVVQAALAQGIRQLVILGAGYDTRPYRLPGMESIKVFEVDLPAVQDDKKKNLQKYLGRLPNHVTFVPIDFDTQILDAVFSGTAFDPAEPALFIWEGVTQYISEEAVRRTLAFIGKSASGSIIVFTYVLKSIIERRSGIPGADHLMDFVAKQSPWIFGLEPSEIPEFLKAYHLSLIQDVGYVDFQEKYLKPMGRDLFVTEGERVVQATIN
jgi:methyltransferase (TIGR00027 family)